MNILPKKRWHVRTKENIARVRRDEAEAAEKAKQERLRTEKANREARLNVLKHKSKQKLFELGGITEPEPTKQSSSAHINLFSNYEDAVKTTNKDHDKEVKDKKEEYEKKIGYLTYLGQDTNEALGKRSWYEVLPEISRAPRSNEIKDTYDKLVLKDADGKPKHQKPDDVNGEVCWKKKQRLDPMNTFKHLHCSYNDKKKLPTTEQVKQQFDNNTSILRENKHKKKKHKKDKHENKEKKLQKLREARLKREQQEKYRTELFLTGLNKPIATEPDSERVSVKPKYNSQFNPELARQNYR